MANRFANVVAALLLLAGCAYATLCCSSALDLSGHARGSDDAYITYRYARNITLGHGAVFNPGERVEGYSNPLYVALMTLPFLIHQDVLRSSIAFNTLAALVALAIFVAHLRPRVGDRATFAAAVLFATSPSIWIWVSSGLETSLVFLLQVAVWVLVERIEDRASNKDALLLAWTSAILVLTRADGFVTPAIAIAYLSARGHRRAVVMSASATVLTLGGLLMWRHAYYHELWPNTYYAKVSSTIPLRARAAARELRSIIACQGIAVYLIAVLFHLGQKAIEGALDWRPSWRSIRFDAFFSAGWLSYWIYVGGDLYEDRFLIILIPIGLSIVLRSILSASTGQVRAFVLGLALVLQLAVPFRDVRYGRTTVKYDRWVMLGRFLHDKRPGRTLAVDAAGKVPFFSGLETIDILGLNDRHIARVHSPYFSVGHDKFDPDYVLSRRPDLIASWFEDETFDLRHGMSRQKYETAGYRLRFVVNSTPASLGNDIIDVEGHSKSEIVSLMRAGYLYAVAERSAAF